MAVPFQTLVGQVGPARLGHVSCLTAPGTCCILERRFLRLQSRKIPDAQAADQCSGNNVCEQTDAERAPGTTLQVTPRQAKRLRATGARLSCRITSPNMRWAATPLAWTRGLPRSPSFPARALHTREVLCAELAPYARAIRRLQRQMDRQRRANNPDHYDERGCIKKPGRGRLSWKPSLRFLATRRCKATRERRLAARRKSLHGHLVHELVFPHLGWSAASWAPDGGHPIR
jgi:hypothetical protein